MTASLLVLPSSCTRPAPVSENDGPVFKIEGELPDIGEYSGKETVKYHKNASDDFVPDEGYGVLVPFFGRSKQFDGESFGADIKMTYSSQGLCTQDGQIVLSPINGYVSYNDYYEEFPYYEITPYTDEMAEMMMRGDSVILPTDGSFKLDLSAGSWICGVGDGIISVLESDPETYGFHGLVCYDYKGNKLFEVPGVWSAGGFSHGYCNVNIGEDEQNACYIDKSGKIVSKKYQNCSYFNEHGIAYVSEYNGKAYLIDSDLNRISDIYDTIYFYSDDHITARGIGFSDVFSTDGKLIASIPVSGFVNVYGSGDDILYSYYDENGVEVYKKSDGTPFVNEKGQSPEIYTPVQGYYMHNDEEKNVQSLFDAKGKIIAELQRCQSVISVLDEEKLIIYTRGSYDFDDFVDGRPVYTDPIKTIIYDFENKKEVAVFDGQGGVYPAGHDERYYILSVYEDYDFGGATKYYLFDTKTQSFVLSDCLMIEYYDVGDGFFAVATDSFCTLYDAELKKVLRIINE